ncbi:MAG: hypothetical protein KatS3mg027_1027 [Bacteroidia bacterium]|nr:MAG: hypothetical protein KatS3mg027_1027 [Bacteroidia bacterium]
MFNGTCWYRALESVSFGLSVLSIVFLFLSNFYCLLFAALGSMFSTIATLFPLIKPGKYRFSNLLLFALLFSSFCIVFIFFKQIKTS